MRWLALLLLLLPGLARAEEVVLGLSLDRVSITTSFDGSDILIFGAVKRDAPIPDEPLDVVVTVAGPSMPVLVRRKSREFGIWVNTDAVEVDLAPSFYVVATTGPIRDVLSNVEDLRHKISIDRAIRSVGAPDTIRDSRNFTNALIRIQREDALYQERDSKVELSEQTLFSTSVKLPANLVEGDYTIRTFLTRQGRVVSQHQTTIDVRKVGLERWLYTLAQEQAVLYGLMSLAIAAAAGWLASTAFAMLRR